MLGAVRPTGARRSWWLRETLGAEPGALAAAAPPLAGSTTADVVILGGGYTGLWTAWRVTELEPGARIVLLEAVVREAIVRAELAEERGERPSRILREPSRMPRRMGYHLGPE